ncbi:MAG TPA: glycerol-3-phosphate 1-O-acyltransferase PlsY [Nevskiales bacterium]|nr:glycerol-3-phosphate 1-O-acyltransferase PlsY [Nevskiales bacterium]
MIEFLLKIAVAYLLGSVMGGLVVGALRGVDIRQQGSGNAGATNALRTQGPLFGLGVFVIDVGKGLLAVGWLPGFNLGTLGASLGPMPAVLALGLPYACALAVVLGHVYPLYFGFRGGKGVATLLGVLAWLLPQTLPFFAIAWVLTLMLTGYVGLASIIGFSAATVAVAAKTGLATVPAGFMYLVLALVLYTHRANLQRLRDGSESRFEKAMLLRRLLRHTHGA